MNEVNHSSSEFYIDDHAVLYGVIAKTANKVLGEIGLSACEQGVILMARERGLRSAKRCIANGDDLSIKNYLVYGEWYDDKDWSKVAVQSLSPVYKINMLACGWHNSWEKYNLTSYVKGYCKEIDKNLLYGFNPQLQLEMNKFLTSGDKHCGFNWINCSFETKDEFDMLMNKRLRHVPNITKDFLYHCGHLLSAMTRIMYFNFGLIVGNTIIEGGIAEYANIFTHNKSQMIQQEAKQDFINL